MPTVPSGSVEGASVMAGHSGGGGGAAAITIVYARLAEHPFASVPWIVTGNVPAVAGDPESKPADVRVRPAGSVPAVTAKLNGAVPPLPVIV